MMATPPKRDPKHHSVTITIADKGVIYSTPELRNAAQIYVERGDTVKWNCNHGNYTVLFKDQSPFKNIGVHARKRSETDISEVTGPPGTYKYSVTVALETGGLITDDPEIIIGQ
jgi:plastocyanin